MTPTLAAPALPRPRGHLALMIALLFLFAVSSVVVTMRFGVIIMSAIGAGVLLTATYAVSEKGLLFSLTVVLSVLTVLSSAMILVFNQGWMVLVSHACIVLLLLLFTIIILRRVLAPGSVTADRIYAAICVYLLAGYAWAFLYSILEQLQPGSFKGLEAEAGANYIAQVMQLKYFSFTSSHHRRIRRHHSGFAAGAQLCQS